MISKLKTRSRTRGSAISQLAASMTFFLPIVITASVVGFEASQAYFINRSLNQAAYNAARQLAINYGQNPTTAMNNTSTVFSSIKFANVVTSSSQFSVPTGGWSTSTTPPTVTVTCTFYSGQYGLPKFPNPDPLHIGSTIVLQGRATARLE